MSQPNPRSVVRLAIVLTALKLKPKDQSTASYLLDLQSCFPSETNGQGSRDWRTYALELEKQLASFKARRDADQEVFSKLLNDTSQSASNSDVPPPKKKSKRNTNKDYYGPEWNWDQTRADWSRFLSSQYPSSPSLIAAYASLSSVVASPDVDPIPHASRLTDAILRALDTVRIFLFSSNASPDLPTHTVLGTPSRPHPQQVDRTCIAMATPLLTYLLRTAFPALLGIIQGFNKRQRTSTDPHVHVDRVLDRLLECVLLPFLRALIPLSFARFAPLVTPPPKKSGRPTRKAKSKDKGKEKRTDASSHQKNADTRTDVFALIGMSLEALDALPLVSASGLGGPVNIANGIKDRLGLEAIRELEALYVAPPLSSTEPSPQSASGPQPSDTRSQVPPTPTPLCVQLHSQPLSQGTSTESRMKQLEKVGGTRVERVRTLATRDAGWFLASTLDLCVKRMSVPSGGPAHCEAATGRTEHARVQLREALLDRVGRLVRSVHAGNSKLAIDAVCQNMLLAICERAMTQLTS